MVGRVGADAALADARCGLLTLVVLPLYVAPRLGRATAALFALLLAVSPLLVIFSRMARPYAITLLLGWIAHGALSAILTMPHARDASAPARPMRVTAALATWLHPVVGPFVVAPLLWGLAAVAAHAARRLAAARSCAGSSLLPPPARSSVPSCCRRCSCIRCRSPPRADSMSPTHRHWSASGTPGRHAIDRRRRRVPGTGRLRRPHGLARAAGGATGALGIVLTLALVVAAGPMWSHLPVTVSRYLLPFVPLLLLAVAAGTVRIAGTASARRPRIARRALALLALAFPFVLLLAQSPLVPVAAASQFADAAPGELHRLPPAMRIRTSRSSPPCRCRLTGPRSPRARAAACASPRRRSISRATTGTRRAGSA